MEQATFLKINPADSVVVCLQPKKKGDVIDIDDKEALLAHVGQNVWKEIRMKLVGPKEQG